MSVHVSLHTLKSSLTISILSSSQRSTSASPDLEPRNEDRSRMQSANALQTTGCVSGANALQTTGFVSGAIGMAGVFAATLMDVWCGRTQQEQHVTSIYTYKGLWKDCEVSSSGFHPPECQSLYSHLNYSGWLR